MDYANTPAAYSYTVHQEATRHRVPHKVLYRVLEKESRWNPMALGKLGEIGLGQLRISTARELCPDQWRIIWLPQPNISCVARILRYHIKRCGSIAAGVSAYNGSRDCHVTKYYSEDDWSGSPP